MAFRKLTRGDWIAVVICAIVSSVVTHLVSRDPRVPTTAVAVQQAAAIPVPEPVHYKPVMGWKLLEKGGTAFDADEATTLYELHTPKEGLDVRLVVDASAPVSVALLPKAWLDRISGTREQADAAMQSSPCFQDRITQISATCTLFPTTHYVLFLHDGRRNELINQGVAAGSAYFGVTEPGNKLTASNKVGVEIYTPGCIEHCDGK